MDSSSALTTSLERSKRVLTNRCAHESFDDNDKGVSDGVMTPRKIRSNGLERHCETTVCRTECKVHKKRMIDASEVSAHWERATEPLYLAVTRPGAFGRFLRLLRDDCARAVRTGNLEF